MHYNGARPKEKRDIRRDIGGYREGKFMDHQLPTEEGSSQFVRHLSIHLCDVLGRVGVSAELRKLHQDCALSGEILKSLHIQFDEPFAQFTFGSACEGTTTPGMNSDIDILCQDDIPVVDNISDAGGGHSLLMISDKHTQPGYVKLQLVNHRQPQTVYIRDVDRDWEESDGEGRICLKHISKLGKDNFFDKRNGPADTNIEKNVDNVQSFRCSRIPERCTEWIARTRQYGWPSQHMLDKMVTLGCFVVGVGHPASRDRNIEWRLSFSLQERELMFSMNIVQHKCYILLKLIKKGIIEPAIGKSISSYHLKTCMLYVIENTKAKLWKRINLVQCEFLCLHVLLEWVLKGFCPNYFIKEENMFDRDIHRTQRKHLVHHLVHLLSTGCEILFQIKLDCIGDFLKRVKKPVQIEYASCIAYCRIKTGTAIVVTGCKERLCCRLNDSQSPLHTLAFLHKVLMYLSQTKYVRDHTDHHTKEAFSYIIPFVHTQLAQSYASLAFSIGELSVKYRVLHLSNYHLNQGLYCDMTSTLLLKVTILYQLEQYEQCILILEQLEQKLNRNLLLTCSCDVRLPVYFNADRVKKCYNLSVASILRRTSTCVMFLRTDTAIIPGALQYEMYRFVGTPHDSRHWSFDRLMDLAVVDAMIYLLFLKYLIYADDNQLIQKTSGYKQTGVRFNSRTKPLSSPNWL